MVLNTFCEMRLAVGFPSRKLLLHACLRTYVQAPIYEISLVQSLEKRAHV